MNLLQRVNGIKQGMFLEGFLILINQYDFRNEVLWYDRIKIILRAKDRECHSKSR